MHCICFNFRTTDSSDLTTLIDKLQKNADKVEKNIYETEQNLNRVNTAHLWITNSIQYQYNLELLTEFFRV